MKTIFIKNESMNFWWGEYGFTQICDEEVKMSYEEAVEMDREMGICEVHLMLGKCTSENAHLDIV
ncbi:hypothetical protein SH2C18_31690 [Clostridium sediminicola]|uniref:hypothetical protein n=1 Tax=Clostridium sediminicola TaxID=3114879 RepID=UPI0031F23F46